MYLIRSLFLFICCAVCIMRLLQVCNIFALCTCYWCAIRLHHVPVTGVQYVCISAKKRTNTL